MMGIRSDRDLSIRDFIMFARVHGMPWARAADFLEGADDRPPPPPPTKRWSARSLRGAARRMGLPTGRLPRNHEGQLALPGVWPNE